MNAIIGFGIFLATLLLFWRVLPRNGKVHRIVGTQWEPYLAILFVGGVGLGLGLVTLWLIQILT
jgi:hypothetical protein